MEAIKARFGWVVFLPRFVVYAWQVRTASFSGHDLEECERCGRKTRARFNPERHGPEPGMNPGTLDKQCLHPHCPVYRTPA